MDQVQPEPERDQFELVAESFLTRYRAGEKPDIGEYCRRFPELESQIRDLMPALIMIEQDFEVVSGSQGEQEPLRTETRQLGDYLIIREIARGGMGIVYEAEQLSLGRRVALKVLPSHMGQDKKAMERFRREAKAAARLHHTNIVPVFEVGQEGNTSFYAMQFIQGQGLDQVIEELARIREREHNGTFNPINKDHQTVQSEFIDEKVTKKGNNPYPDPNEKEINQLAKTLLNGHFSTSQGPMEKADPPTINEFGSNPGGPTEIAPFWQLSESDPGNKDPKKSPSPMVSFETTPAFLAGNSAVLPGGTAVSETRSSTQRLSYFHSIAQIARQVSQGLAYAHHRGILHRDIKPSNLLLDSSGVVWITDFGLAKAEEDGLTKTGDILGTLRYMAPERFRGEGDARADIYAFGLTLYELLTLKPAFSSSNRLKLIEQIKNEEPLRPRLLDPQIPRDLETIVLKAIDKDPDQRYSTTDALAEDLRRFLSDEPIQARRNSLFEQYWRWSRRNPTIAVLGAVLSAVLIVTTVGSLFAASRFAWLAEREKNAAEAQKLARQETENANTLLKEAQQILTLRDYSSRMNLAQSAFEANDISRVHNLLDQVKPKPEEVDLRGFEWEYWKRLCHQDFLEFKGFKGSVQRVTYSPDGSRLASADWSGRIVVMEAKTGTVQLDFRGHKSRVNGLVFSPDNKRLVTGSSDKTIKIWDAATGKLILGFEAHSGPVMALAISPDGKRIASGSATKSLKIWNSTNGQLLHNVGGAHEMELTAVAFNRDGSMVASAGRDGRLSLWNSEDLKTLRKLEGHGAPVQCFAFSPDGSFIVSGDFSGELRVWETKTGNSTQILRGHDGAVYGTAFHPDGVRFASAGADRTIRVWGIGKEKEIRRFLGHTDLITSVAFSPDGENIASSAFDRTVRAWNLETPTEPMTIEDVGVIDATVFSPDGKWVAFGGTSNIVEIRDALTGQPKAILKGHKSRVRCIRFSPDGSQLGSSSEDGTVRIWETRTFSPLLVLDGLISYGHTLAFSPDNKRLAAVCDNGTIKVFEFGNNHLIQTLKASGETVYGIAFSPDGKKVAATGKDATIRIWDVETGKALLIWKGHTATVYSIAFSHDGRWLASAGSDQIILLSDATTGEEIKSLKGHSGIIRAIAFSPDDSRLASVSDDRTLKLFDPVSGEELMSLKGHGGWIHGLDFSPDGGRIVTGSFDRTVKIWTAKAPLPNEFLEPE